MASASELHGLQLLRPEPTLRQPPNTHAYGNPSLEPADPRPPPLTAPSPTHAERLHKQRRHGESWPLGKPVPPEGAGRGRADPSHPGQSAPFATTLCICQTCPSARRAVCRGHSPAQPWKRPLKHAGSPPASASPGLRAWEAARLSSEIQLTRPPPALNPSAPVAPRATNHVPRRASALCGSRLTCDCPHLEKQAPEGPGSQRPLQWLPMHHPPGRDACVTRSAAPWVTRSASPCPRARLLHNEQV